VTDSDNPFMVKPKKAEKNEPNQISIDDDVISFMINPDEKGKLRSPSDVNFDEKPHWENAGTPIWDKKVKDIHKPDYEVVDHDS